MSDYQAIADRVEIEAPRGEFTDAVMMRDYHRVASLFTPDGVWRMPKIPPSSSAGRKSAPGAIGFRVLWTTSCRPPTRARSSWRAAPASGRAYICELIHLRDGSSEPNYAIYHDRYQGTADGWKFTERVHEVRYLDTTPLAGSAPCPGQARGPGLPEPVTAPYLAEPGPVSPSGREREAWTLSRIASSTRS